MAKKPNSTNSVAAVGVSKQLLLLAIVLTCVSAVFGQSSSRDSVVTSKLPQGIQQSIERRTSITGQLSVAYEDSPGSSTLRYFLKANGKQHSLHFREKVPTNLRTGDQITVSGSDLKYQFWVDSVTSTPAASSASAVPMVSNSAFGEHKVLVILVNFQDKQTQLFSASYARDVVFNQTNAYIQENSFNQTWLTGDVFGWLTIPSSYTTCDPATIGTQAQAAAAAAGADLSAYAHYIYMFPANACSFAGMSTVGGNPSEIWLKGQRNLAVVAHEFGHSLGLMHSRSFDCGADVICSNGTIDEYGDHFDLMGNADTAHFNVAQKERLGWLNYGGSPPLTTVSASGTYWIDAYATTSGNPKGLKILKSIDPVTGERTWYYVERRSPYGYDSWVSGNPNILGGVIIHQGADSNGPNIFLLDLTPVTDSWFDPALAIGQTFSDLSAGVTITVVSADNTGAVINVSLGPQTCTPANPTVTLSASQSAPAGTAVSYTVVVTNNDTVGCAASYFDFGASVPASWGASFGLTSVRINPSTSATTTLQITSPSTVASGTYPIGVTTSNITQRNFYGSASGTYVVVPPPSIVLSSGQPTYTRNQTANVNASVSSGGSAVTGAATQFTMTRADGSVVTGNAVTGSTGIATFRYTFRKKDRPGTYQVLARTTVSGISVSATTNFVVK